MWHDIQTNREILEFMENIFYFHDSCIKELKYISGAYVTPQYAMHPLNDQRILRIIFQRQFKNNSIIELEFSGLKYLKLNPNDENYTCEILDATIILKDDCIYWCDSGDLKEEDLERYDGTIICATRLRWRSLETRLGKEEYYCERQYKTGDGSLSSTDLN